MKDKKSKRKLFHTIIQKQTNIKNTCFILVALIIVIIVISNLINNENFNAKSSTYISNKSKTDLITTEEARPIEEATIAYNKVEKLKIEVNNIELIVKLEVNEASKMLVEKLRNGPITINSHEYGNFEKVGNLGFSLPSEDVNITTTAGDIVLYQGNQIAIFYDSNSWIYTKLGKIQNISQNELKNILGNGDVTFVISIF